MTLDYLKNVTFMLVIKNFANVLAVKRQCSTMIQISNVILFKKKYVIEHKTKGHREQDRMRKKSVVGEEILLGLMPSYFIEYYNKVTIKKYLL